MATELFQGILDVLGIGWDCFFAVPGNHDVHRGTHEDVWKHVREKVRWADDLNVSRWLDGRGGFLGSDDRERLFGRFRAYRAWLCAIRRGDLAVFPGYRQTLRLPHRPFDVHVIGLDSAWLCGDDNDTGKLRLTDGHLERTLLHLAYGENIHARERLDAAAELVERCGYGRRRPDLAFLEGVFRRDPSVIRPKAGSEDAE